MKLEIKNGNGVKVSTRGQYLALGKVRYGSSQQVALRVWWTLGAQQSLAEANKALPEKNKVSANFLVRVDRHTTSKEKERGLTNEEALNLITDMTTEPLASKITKLLQEHYR